VKKDGNNSKRMSDEDKIQMFYERARAIVYSAAQA
jgi:hypothetical protein